MKRNYLISVIVMGLIVLSLYSTYAMFTETIEIDQVINMTASPIPLESKIVEYEQVEVNANDNKIIELNINNKTESNLYYGTWYQMVNPEVKEETLIIAKHVNSEDETTGLINVNSSKKVIIVIDNKTNSNVTIYMGVGYSKTSSLGLPTNRYVISGEYGTFKVNLKASNGTITGGNTITNLLPNGSFENTGWSGCSYNTTYKKYGNYSCALTGTTSTPEVLATNNQSIYLDNTHIYYSRVEAYQTSKTGSQSWQTYWPIAEPTFGTVEFGEANKWHRYSLVANRTSFSSGNYPLRFDYNNSNNNGTVYYDGGMLIDLTASYGSGNEPSKEWLDENIEYFEGTVSNSSKEVIIRNDITFTVTPNTGYEYDSINCEGGSYNTGSNILTVNEVGEDKVCEINFKPITYSVGVTAGTGGTVSGTSSKTVNYNGSTTFTVTPNTGYKYSSVSCPSGITGSYSTSNNTLTVSNVKASGTCTVNFTAITYTVTAAASTGGTVSGSSSKTVNYNGSTTFTVTPNTGYQYSSVSCPSGITGSYSTSNNTLTVSGVKASGTCTINFTKKTYTVRVSVTNGTSSPTSRTVSHGSSTTFTVTPNSGYEYESLSCTGGSYNASTKVLTISNVTSTRTCTIKFKKSGILITEYITNLYNSSTKSKFTNNNIQYEKSESVSLMTDIGGNIRYYGRNPNNYVSFNNELWRIIGVFKNIDDGTGKKETRIKLSRKSEGNWSTWADSGINEWTSSDLKAYYNGTYLNTISSQFRSMIGNAVWNLGGVTTSSTGGVTKFKYYANEFYNLERGTTVYSGRSTKWTGKIALMYPSDYMYACDLSKCTLDSGYWGGGIFDSCLDTWLISPTYNLWTITPMSNVSDKVVLVSRNISNSSVKNAAMSRPVLYLNSNVLFTGGTGALNDPFILG